MRIHEVHQHCTRASAGLSVPYARTNYRKFALKCREPLVWNMIPINIREQKSFYSFKTQWKEYIMGNQGSGVARGQRGQAPPGAKVGGAKMSKTFKFFY